MKLSLVLNSLVLASLTLNADPMSRQEIAADAVWVAHLDVDQFKKTMVGKHVLAEMEKPEAQAKLEAFQAMFNFDPSKNVRSITLYGVSNEPKDAVLFVEGDFDTERLVTLARAAKDYESANHGAHTIHVWTDEKREHQGELNPRVYASIHGAHTVIFAQSQEAVARALDVLDGDKPSLASTSHFSSLSDTPNSFLQAATRKLEAPEGQPHSAILKHAASLSLIGKESNNSMSLKLAALAKSDESATQMQQIGQGLVALMSMQTEKPDLVKLAQALKIEQSGDVLTATLEMPAQDVIAAMQEAEKRKAEKNDG